MRNRSGISGVASSPVLVGAVTVLVVIVAVFLAYNANNGLPFVSTYDLKARVPNADALVKGNEVRIGGVRVGIVKSVVPVQLEDGKVAAELTLKLDKNAEPLPVDSTIMVRPKSALGLKFLQITPGDSSQGFKAGETIPVSSADAGTGRHRRVLRHVRRADPQGDPAEPRRLRQRARRPRPADQRSARRAAPRWSKAASRRCATLVAPSTDFAGFWEALEALSATVAPVAETQANLFVALDSDLRSPSPASPAPSSRKRSKKARRPWTRSTPTCRRSAPSCATRHASSPPCSPGREGAGAKPRR